jgi:hypothetical protein
MKIRILSCTLLLTFASILSAQNHAINAPLIGIQANTLVFIGDNHSSNDFHAGIGATMSFRFNIEQFGVNLNLGFNQNSLNQDATLHLNSALVRNRFPFISIGYNLLKEYNLLEPRIGFGRYTTIYNSSFRSKQNFGAIGLKYAYCLWNKGLFASISSDFIFNVENSISAPNEFNAFMNRKSGFLIYAGLEYRLWKNR